MRIACLPLFLMAIVARRFSWSVPPRREAGTPVDLGGAGDGSRGAMCGAAALFSVRIHGTSRYGAAGRKLLFEHIFFARDRVAVHLAFMCNPAGLWRAGGGPLVTTLKGTLQTWFVSRTRAHAGVPHLQRSWLARGWRSAPAFPPPPPISITTRRATVRSRITMEIVNPSGGRVAPRVTIACRARWCARSCALMGGVIFESRRRAARHPLRSTISIC